jgi:hypothetical protein
MEDKKVKIKEITYPITVYSVSDKASWDCGELSIKVFDGPPTNYDSHQIRGNKFIWTVDDYDDCKYNEFYLSKKEAKKIALAFTKKRLNEYKEKVTKLKKQLKEIRAA